MGNELQQSVESRCVHFTGIQKNVCKAGVLYQSLMVEGWKGLPCIATGKLTHEERCAACPHFKLPTPEEVKEELEGFAKAFEKIAAGLSTCCEAPLNTAETKRSVTKTCSKCGHMVMHGRK